MLRVWDNAFRGVVGHKAKVWGNPYGIHSRLDALTNPNPFGIYKSWDGGCIDAKDGDKDLIDVFLLVDLIYFRNLATTLEMTQITSTYISKAAYHYSQKIQIHNINAIAQSV